MTITLIKVFRILGIILFILIGCGEQKTTVTDVKKQSSTIKIEPQTAVKIETHGKF